MNFKVICVSLILLFLLLGTVCAEDANSTRIFEENNNINEIYVSDVGSDLNTGSEDSPYSSIGKAVNNVSESDIATIHLSKGTFAKDNDSNLDLDFNHKVYHGSLSFIGSGVNETFIDGQSTFRFAKIGQNANITFKNLTFINFKAFNGGTLSNKGTLYVDNCVFKDSIATGYYGGAILSNVGSNLFVKNSQFVSCKVNSWNQNEFQTQGGGAINIQNSNQVFLQNNTFISNSISQLGGNGFAVCVGGSKPNILNNKFININSFINSKDSALSVWSDTANIFNNQFINCSNPSDEYSVVYLNSGSYAFLNNTFFNSTNSVGNIFLRGGIVGTDFIIKNKSIDVGQLEINQGLLLEIGISDDVGNIIKSTNFGISLINENKSYLFYPKESDGLFFINFNTVPEKGIYDLRIRYDALRASTDSLAAVYINYNSAVEELYVSPNGFDGNKGTKDNPFRTIQQAIDVGFEKSFNVVVNLKEGKYLGEDNVNVTIANKGSLKIIGEKYGNVIIDGENRNWFLDVGSNVTIKNITFINGYGENNQNLVSGANKLLLECCIIENCSVEDSFTLKNTLVDNVTYTNNKGNIFYDEYAFRSKVLNSYFANNQGIYRGYGLIYNEAEGFSIDGCKFINNTAGEKGGAVVSVGGLKCYNSYFEGNYAPRGGAIYTESQHMYYFENNTFVSNKAITDGVFTSDQQKYSYTFLNCKFIGNSAKNAGVTILIVGNFTNCSFINNSAEYGGAIIVTPISKQEYVQFENEDVLGIPVEDEEYIDMYKLSFDNVIFKGNIASVNGNDLFLDDFNSYPEIYDRYIYCIDLTINFRDATVNSLSSNLEAEVHAPCDAVVGGNYIKFKLDGIDAGNAEIINGVATLRYDGFNNNESHVLSGNLLKFSNPYTNISNAAVNVALGKILNHVEVWLSPLGDDEVGDGNKTNPFRSLSHAIGVATENCRDVIIHLDEGTYDSNLDFGLKLSAKNNITLIGLGADKTVIDGGNNDYFARITFGSNIIKIQNLTIRNMGINNTEIAPITIDSNANLHLVNVVLSNCINEIKNDGDLFINDSILTKNIGIVSGGNIFINNSIISQSKGFIKGNIIINNSFIKDIIANNQFDLISGKKCHIENTLISNNCTNSSLKEFGIGGEGKFSPALAVVSDEIYMVNASIVNNYHSPIYEYNYDTGMGSKFAVFGYLYAGSRSVSCYNSSFSNFNYIWAVNGLPLEYRFEGCIFNNISMIAQSQTVGDKSKFIISNSVFLNSGHVIDRYNRGDREDPVCIFENNYWGNNEKPVVNFVNAPRTKSFDPETWVILTYENDKYIFKHTDGVNVSEVVNLPLYVAYALVDNQMVQVVNIGGKVYQITQNGISVNALAETSVLKPVIENTVFASDLTLAYGDRANFTAKLLYPWGDPLANVDVTYSINSENYTGLADENGSLSFKVDFNAGVYDVVIANPVSKQVSINTIVINRIKPDLIVEDVSTVYNGGKYLTINVDAPGNINVLLNGKIIKNQVKIPITLAPNTYAAVVTYEGDVNYEKVIVNVKIKVTKATPKITGKKKVTFNAKKKIKKYTVTLNDNRGKVMKKVKVTLKVKGKTYKATTNAKGKATFKIKNLKKKGKYTAKIKFAGNKNFKVVSKSVKITVKK